MVERVAGLAVVGKVVRVVMRVDLLLDLLDLLGPLVHPVRAPLHQEKVAKDPLLLLLAAPRSRALASSQRSEEENTMAEELQVPTLQEGALP